MLADTFVNLVVSGNDSSCGSPACLAVGDGRVPGTYVDLGNCDSDADSDKCGFNDAVDRERDGGRTGHSPEFNENGREIAGKELEEDNVAASAGW